MVAGTCPKCGGPNGPGAAVCQWCSAELPRAPLTAPRPLEYRPLTPPRIPSSRPVNPGVIVAIVVVVIVIILIVAALSFHPPSPPSLPGTNAVTVTEMYAHSPDNACGLNGVNEPGFTANAFTWAPVGWVIPASESVSLPCTVTNITTNTSGFEIAATLPVTATSQMTILSFAVFTPASYNGPLDVTFT